MNTVTQERTIRVTGTGTILVDCRKIRPMQGSLKVREKPDIDKIIKSIILHGFSFPFFIWKEGDKNHALDGHGRLKALAEMRKAGYCLDEDNTLFVDDGPPWTIPPLPAVYIEAANMDEAKEKLLKLNSRYGAITEASFRLFTEGLKGLDLGGINIGFDKIEIKAPSIGSNTATAPLPAAPVMPGVEAGEENAGTFQPNLEPDIKTGEVSEKELDKADEKLETAMLHKGEVQTIELACPACGETFSISVADALNLIEEARK